MYQQELEHRVRLLRTKLEPQIFRSIEGLVESNWEETTFKVEEALILSCLSMVSARSS